MLPFGIILIGIFLFDMNMKNAFGTIKGCQLEIFQDELGQQKLNEGQEAFQNELDLMKSQTQKNTTPSTTFDLDPVDQGWAIRGGIFKKALYGLIGNYFQWS